MADVFLGYLVSITAELAGFLNSGGPAIVPLLCRCSGASDGRPQVPGGATASCPPRGPEVSADGVRDGFYPRLRFLLLRFDDG